MNKEVRIPYITKFEKRSIHIVEKAKKRNESLSFATKVDDGFIQKLLEEEADIGKFISLEYDPDTNILILHFERVNKQLEKELAHEMR